jgi:cardiolipin synthase
VWIVIAVAGTLLVVLLVVNLATPDKKIEHPITHTYAVGDPQFFRAVNSLLGPPLTSGNTVTALQNGDQIFAAMLEAIASARQTITFETFIFWSGTIGQQFTDALIERTRNGVRVHLMVDWVGSSKMDDAMIDSMKTAGVEIEHYRPLRWYNLGRMNNRTHRKLLVVDGKVGFTGGVGIADKWGGNAQDPDHWRDAHFRLEGPATAQMQSAFMDNWIETRNVVHHDDQYFPALEATGPHTAQVFSSSFGTANDSIRLMYLLSLAAAARSIQIANAYFVPDTLTVQTLVSARQRGVHVEIVVPGEHIDAAVVRRASRSLWGPMLEAGVMIYEYQPTMLHAKVMIVDGTWTSVGSTNFDSRSFLLNDEANLNVYDQDFARELGRVFEADKACSRQVTHSMWLSRPRSEKAKEWLAATLRLQL